MINYKKIIKNQETRLKIINFLFSAVPDVPYLKLVYRIKVGDKLNLRTPKGYNEKQNWLKLFDIHPEYTQLVDKIAVRQHVANIIGEEHLIPLLGTWESFDDIDFSTLPEQFVLKCNHDSGSVHIIRDKNSVDTKNLKKFYDFRMHLNPFVIGREYPYKNVKPMIMAEKFMVQTGQDDITDYKFLCFDGVPKYVFIVSNRSTVCTMDYYDMNFNRVDICDLNHAPSYSEIQKPRTFEEMKKMAHLLAEGIKFVRMDFYEINGKVYFGEYTFFDGGGFAPLCPKWERRLGDMIHLPDIDS